MGGRWEGVAWGGGVGWRGGTLQNAEKKEKPLVFIRPINVESRDWMMKKEKYINNSYFIFKKVGKNLCFEKKVYLCKLIIVSKLLATT